MIYIYIIYEINDRRFFMRQETYGKITYPLHKRYRKNRIVMIDKSEHVL